MRFPICWSRLQSLKTPSTTMAVRLVQEPVTPPGQAIRPVIPTEMIPKNHRAVAPVVPRPRPDPRAAARLAEQVVRQVPDRAPALTPAAAKAVPATQRILVARSRLRRLPAVLRAVRLAVHLRVAARVPVLLAVRLTKIRLKRRTRAVPRRTASKRKSAKPELISGLCFPTGARAGLSLQKGRATRHWAVGVTRTATQQARSILSLEIRYCPRRSGWPRYCNPCDPVLLSRTRLQFDR